MATPIPTSPSQLPRNDRYLRNRPFLCIEFIRRPAKGVNTAKAGWQDVTGNLSTFEKPSVVDRVNDTQLVKSGVIIDVLNGKVVKNGFPETPEEEVVNYFLSKYKEQVTEAMDIWLSRVAQKVADKKAAPVADGVYSAV